MNVTFEKLISPNEEVARALTKWENDPDLAYRLRPNQDQYELERKFTVTLEEIAERLKYHTIYLIYLDGQLVGEMGYQVDPAHLFKKETGTAWVGIDIGEKIARGKGIGMLAMQHLENEIRAAGYKRIELGVFEFNTNAHKLYQKAGYVEIGRIPEFTFWQGSMWTDIRMEKYL
jgi:RimJ/RimL family protein N-acetyltransferase